MKPVRLTTHHKRKKLKDIVDRRLGVKVSFCLVSLWLLVWLFPAASFITHAQQTPADDGFAIWGESRERRRDYAEYLKKQAAADPHNLPLQLDLARANYALAVEYDIVSLAEAERLLNQVLAAEPDNALALALRGSLLGLKIGFNIVPAGQHLAVLQQSNQALDRAVQLSPDNIEIRQIRGFASLYAPSIAGRDAIAVEDFAQIIRLLAQKPNTERRRAQVYLTLGDAYRKLGNRDQARASWQQAQTLQPNTSLATAAEARLQFISRPDEQSSVNTREIAAFFGFVFGTAIFVILTGLLIRDLRRTSHQRRGMWAALLVAGAAAIWNSLNLLLVILGAFRQPAASAWQLWQRNDLTLALTLLPIPFGLVAAYRLYPATFMDIVLKRGTALFTLFGLSLLYGRFVAVPANLALGKVSNESLRWIFYTTIWLWLYALYPSLRDLIYRLVDRHLFKRRNYSGLLDWFDERLRVATEETSLLERACQSIPEAFTAEPARFVSVTDAFAKQLLAVLSTRTTSVLLRQELRDKTLSDILAAQRCELVMAIYAGAEPVGVILVGARTYEQSFLSEELSVLRAVSATINRRLENLRLHEARRKHAIQEEELRKLVAQSELMALRAQINPHFFFNALNSVASLITEDPPRAETLLENLGELFRHAFKPSAEIIPLQQEWELVETYLAVEKVRLGDKLQFKPFILPEARAARLPALTIQPLIENAIKHGIGRVNTGGVITLSASLRQGQLHIIVADTGAGISPAQMDDLLTRGVGLANVNQRLIKLYGPTARLRIDSAPEQGTTVAFSIPLTSEPQLATSANPGSKSNERIYEQTDSHIDRG